MMSGNEINLQKALLFCMKLFNLIFNDNIQYFTELFIQYQTYLDFNYSVKYDKCHSLVLRICLFHI